MVGRVYAIKITVILIKNPFYQLKVAVSDGTFSITSSIEFSLLRPPAPPLFPGDITVTCKHRIFKEFVNIYYLFKSTNDCEGL